jgi:large subunit ribosomal protein L22
MQIRAIYRGAHISAFKCREVTREIQGLPVAAALDILTFTPRKAARLVEKTLKSAIANAENNNDLRAERLVVQEAVVGEATTLKRFQPKARGSAGPIRKRTSHIRIILTDEIEIKPPRAKSKAKSKPKAKSGAARKKSGASPVAAAKAPEPETPAVQETAPAAPETTGAETTTSTQE